MTQFLSALFLLFLAATSAFSQEVLLTGGYTRVGENSFTGAASGGLHTVFPLGRHVAAGVGLTAARNRQNYREFLPNADPFDPAGRPRAITEYHNSLYSLQGFVAGRMQLAPRLELLAGPSAGLYFVGARERSTEAKAGVGLWSSLTYRQLGGSRFNVEALFHPRLLLTSLPVDDADFRFGNQRLFIWDAQVGLSYDLRKQP
ncbi:hypothetical protein [Hymenobacter rubripertinctus]|uniref:Outer membrane protein beta-barrel domain-containing protein n=1 Tax=Hymenobacter rubripertinctus TaxID=2029981 RepID=A0A418R805_9BACT|nr:hypothetical protein [Hymenobacter rubripertinctus]RIY13435.1 hypothetical protein D0T11_03080 [Hymenobacter rubripertinctus]